jgi:hypothetical protein
LDVTIFNDGGKPAGFNTCSVMHTGSKFLCTHLLRGFEGQWQAKHIDGESDIRWLAAEKPCIIPMRNPRSVAVSHFTRYGDIGRMCAGFRALAQDIDPLGPYYLPLDTDDRQDYLDKINDEFGLSLETRWPIIGSCWEKKELSCEAQAQLDELIDELQPFFARFGYG